MPHAEWLEAGAAAGLREAWADLAARALEPSVFNDPGFMLPALRHLAGWPGPRLLAIRDEAADGRLIGLCVVAAGPPGRPLAAWLHPQATAAFPLLDARRAGDALAALLAATRGAPRPAGLLLHGLAEEGATFRLLAAAPVWLGRIEARSRAVLRAGEPAGAGRHAKEMRRQARRLAEQGQVSLTSERTPAGVAAGLELFLELERRGWKGRRGTALGQSARRAAFARAMTAALAGAGSCRIDRLDLDGTPVAMGLVLRSGPTGFFWKTAYDERFARFSPGAHLAEAVGRTQARDPGLASTDSCAIPGHAMIDRLWPGRMTVVDVLVGPAAPPSRSLALALRVERGRRALRGWAKRQVTAVRRRLPGS